MQNYLEDNTYSAVVDGLDITNAVVGTSLKTGIKKSVRFNNIGIGSWNKGLTQQLDEVAGIMGASADDVAVGLAGGAKTGALPKGIRWEDMDFHIQHLVNLH